MSKNSVVQADCEYFTVVESRSGHKMSMDFYFSGQDALSLQEMIDFDSKREYDDYNSIDFELGASVPPLDLDENSVNGLISTSHHGNGLHMWLNGHAMTNSSPLSNSNYNLDFIDGDAEAAMMQSFSLF